MAWTNPTTQVTGALITAAEWNTDLVDNLVFLHDREREMWLGFITSSAEVTLGDHKAGYLQSNGQLVFYNFAVPSNFDTLVSAALVFTDGSGTPGTTNATITSDYAAVGEAYDANSGSLTSDLITAVNKTLYSLDISSVLSSIAANDLVGIKVTRNSAGGSVGAALLGIRIRYSLV